jgi:predicted dehydrogenase
MSEIKIGIVGLGLGKSHAKAVIQSGKCDLEAICDTDVERLNKIGDDLGVAKRYTDFYEMLKDDSINAYVIATPDNFHRDMVCAALKAGKDVLCEKPLALHLDECKDMIETSKETGKILMVGQVCRVAPGFVTAKKIIDDGLLGELYFIESEYAHDYSALTGWRTDPVIKRHPVTGGGCHAVDLIRWFAGEDPVEAFSYSNKKVLTDWPCDDTTIALMKFEENLMAKVYVSTGCKRDYTMRTVIYGTKGTVIADNTSPHISLYLESFEGVDKLYGHPMKHIAHQIPVKINSHNVLSEIEEFCQCIVDSSALRITAEEGAKTVAVCETIIKSSETGKPEKVVY